MSAPATPGTEPDKPAAPAVSNGTHWYLQIGLGADPIHGNTPSAHMLRSAGERYATLAIGTGGFEARLRLGVGVLRQLATALNSAADDIEREEAGHA